MSLSDAGNVASFGRLAMNPTPLGMAGLGLGVASSMFGGKAGKQRVIKPGYSNGQYTMNGDPYAPAQKYQIAGDKGQYDLYALQSKLPPGMTMNQYVRSQNDPALSAAYTQRFNGTPEAKAATGISRANYTADQRGGLQMANGIHNQLLARYAKSNNLPGFTPSAQSPAPQQLAQALMAPPSYMTPQAAMAARA